MSDKVITVRTKGRRLAIEPGEIIFLKAEGCYTRLFLDNNEEGILSTKPLFMLKVQLSGNGFLQCHKSNIVNSHRIDAFDSKNRTIQVGKHVIQVSKRQAAHIFRHLLVRGIPDMDLDCYS